MDIDMNLVLPITIGSFAVCLLVLCCCGEWRARVRRQEARAALVASATPVHVEAVVVTST